MIINSSYKNQNLWKKNWSLRIKVVSLIKHPFNNNIYSISNQRVNTTSFKIRIKINIAIAKI